MYYGKGKPFAGGYGYPGFGYPGFGYPATTAAGFGSAVPVTSVITSPYPI